MLLGTTWYFPPSLTITHTSEVRRVFRTALVRDGRALACRELRRERRLRWLQRRPEERIELRPNLADEYLMQIT